MTAGGKPCKCAECDGRPHAPGFCLECSYSGCNDGIPCRRFTIPVSSMSPNVGHTGGREWEVTFGVALSKDWRPYPFVIQGQDERPECVIHSMTSKDFRDARRQAKAMAAQVELMSGELDFPTADSVGMGSIAWHVHTESGYEVKRHLSIVLDRHSPGVRKALFFTSKRHWNQGGRKVVAREVAVVASIGWRLKRVESLLVPVLRPESEFLLIGVNPLSPNVLFEYLQEFRGTRFIPRDLPPVEESPDA